MATRKKKHTCLINEKPIAKGRPRLGRRGRVFTPQRTLDAEAAIAAAWDGPKFEGPVKLKVVFGYDTIEVTVEKYPDGGSRLRGDVDNYLKTVMDGLNGVAWVDDKQVFAVEAEKT
jgi:Holliday junction resolvase RusA-like endonuclease